MKESLSNRLTPLPFPALTPDTCRDELTACARRIARNMGLYGEKFPSACTIHNRYVLQENNDWTNGFWTGMQAMAWEFSGDRAYLDGVERNVASFKARLAAHHVLDHHDIGFLYSLSAVAYWKLTEREALTPLILAAADLLVNRFHHSAGFIQAWGTLNDPQEYRLIIDSLINLPLLHVAAKISGESRYREVAERHYAAVINNIFREDGSTFHTFYFDQTSGAPSYGKTFQGYSDNSCWAAARRGPFSASRFTGRPPAKPTTTNGGSRPASISSATCRRTAFPPGICCWLQIRTPRKTAPRWRLRSAACWKRISTFRMPVTRNWRVNVCWH